MIPSFATGILAKQIFNMREEFARNKLLTDPFAPAGLLTNIIKMRKYMQ
jgi:hypothetical protein